jgi:hypothetical protein
MRPPDRQMLLRHYGKTLEAYRAKHYIRVTVALDVWTKRQTMNGTRRAASRSAFLRQSKSYGYGGLKFQTGRSTSSRTSRLCFGGTLFVAKRVRARREATISPIASTTSCASNTFAVRLRPNSSARRSSLSPFTSISTSPPAIYVNLYTVNKKRCRTVPALTQIWKACSAAPTGPSALQQYRYCATRVGAP